MTAAPPPVDPTSSDDGAASPADLATVADRFSASAELYAASEQRGGDDLVAVVEAVAAVHPDLVVDVATGPGSTALALAPVAGRVLGTDVSPGMIDTARARAVEAGLSGVTFEVADAEHLPVGDGEADAVTCRIAAHHFPDVPAALAEMARVLRPGGRLVLLDSAAPHDASVAAFLHELEVTRDPTHVRAHTPERWAELVTEAGFVVESVTLHPKPKAFESWLERGGADPADHDRVRELVHDAPPAAVSSLAIQYDADGRPVSFTDDKALVVAVRTDAPAPGRASSVAFVAIDHVQLAMPPGEEAAAEAFYAGVLGLERVPKPEPLASRGGCWFRQGPVVLHLGAEAGFRPARKAHPALVVVGLEVLAARLEAAGHPLRWDDELPGVRRGHLDDPFGNRVELIAADEPAAPA